MIIGLDLQTQKKELKEGSRLYEEQVNREGVRVGHNYLVGKERKRAEGVRILVGINRRWCWSRSLADGAESEEGETRGSVFTPPA